MFIDSHLHLDFDDFDADRAALLDQARAAGIRTFLTIGVRVRDFDRVLRTARDWPGVWCSVGTLPHYADEEADVTAAELIAIAEDPLVVGIGECGLDTFFGDASWDNQLRVLREHIRASRETGLPLIIHSVRQDQAMAQILSEEHARGAFPIVMHGYSGGMDLARTCLDLGAWFSFGGLTTYADNDHIREVARWLPDDRLLIETDAPSLPPEPFGPDDRNTPENLLVNAGFLAGLRNTSTEEIGRLTSANFHDAFRKIPRT